MGRAAHECVASAYKNKDVIWIPRTLFLLCSQAVRQPLKTVPAQQSVGGPLRRQAGTGTHRWQSRRQLEAPLRLSLSDRHLAGHL